MKRQMLGYGLLLLCSFGILVGCSKGVEHRPVNSKYHGRWYGKLLDGTDLTIKINETTNQVYLSSKKEACKDYPIEKCNLKNSTLFFEVPKKTSTIRFEINLESKEFMTGTASFNGNVETITFQKESDTYGIEDPETSEFSHSYEALQTLITLYSNYEPDGLAYEFHYTLGTSEDTQNIINQYHLDTVFADKTDVELMQALLTWEGNLLDHSSYPIAEKHDIQSLLIDGVAHGANCRSLSLILAELLRSYGIKAQVVACYPYDSIAFDYHVVVHAYSEKLKQWILLDPTYSLMLQEDDGTYVNLQTLRNIIVEDTPVSCNEEAGYNGGSMGESDLTKYLTYMAKNSCYYVKTIENYNGSDGVDGNTNVILVSSNYESAINKEKEEGRILTTDEKRFWE